MKIFIKLLILMLIIACAAPFLLKGPDGKALLSIDKIGLPALPSFLVDIKSNSQQIFSGNGQQQTLKSNDLQVYKWVDKKGVTHYSDQSDSKHASQLTKIQHITILPAHKSESEPVIEKSASSDMPISLTTIPLQDIPKLIDDTKEVKRMMEDRENQIERALY